MPASLSRPEMVLLLLAAVVEGSHTTADAPELLRRHYTDMCAHPPSSQMAMAPGPLEQTVLEDHGLEFVALNVVFRHGARTLIHDAAPCFGTHLEGSFTFDCGVRSGVVLQWLANETSDRKVIGRPPLLKRYRDTHAGDAQTDCGPAQLLDEAADQFRALGGALRQAYFKRLPKEPTLNTTHLYSTDTDRTIASTYLLQHFLFKDAGGQATSSHPPAALNTRPENTDAWRAVVGATGSCSAAQSAITEASRQAALSSDVLESLKARWFAAFGKPFLASCHDPVLVANCSGKLPTGALRGDESYGPLLAEAVAANYLESKGMYMNAKEAWSALVGPALLELQDFARRQAAGEEHKAFSLWATHDTTVIPMLVALDAWDGEWPQYSEATILEVYRSVTDSRKPWVRLLRRGKPVQVPSCQPLGPAGLCDLEHLLPESVTRLRDPVVLDQICSGQIELLASKPQLAAVREQNAPTALSLGSCACLALTLVAAFAGGVAVGRHSWVGARRLGGDTAVLPLLRH